MTESLLFFNLDAHNVKSLFRSHQPVIPYTIDPSQFTMYIQSYLLPLLALICLASSAPIRASLGK